MMYLLKGFNLAAPIESKTHVSRTQVMLSYFTCCPTTIHPLQLTDTRGVATAALVMRGFDVLYAVFMENLGVKGEILLMVVGGDVGG